MCVCVCVCCDVWRNEMCRRRWLEEVKARYIIIEHKELCRNSNREHGVGKSKSLVVHPW